MNITISGQHLNIHSRVQEYVQERMPYIVSKYFEHAVSGDVHFIKQPHNVLCNIIVHEGTGHHFVIKSEASCDDIYSSFDIALTKCEKQLRKYKSKLKDRHNRVKVSEIKMSAMKYIIKPLSSEADHTDENKEFSAVTIAEKPIEILDLSVEEALMKMDLENLPALMFKNAKTDRMNIVYYRRDGNISWVDSK